VPNDWDLPPKFIVNIADKSWSETAGDAIGVGGWKIVKSITFSRGADWAMKRKRI
jgi:hypothetical protein